MNCIECDRPANGNCRFCGRALCKDHFNSANFIVSVAQSSEDQAKKTEVLVTKNVLKCNHCEPVGELITLEKFKED
ncbi:hypothetical protein OAK75_12835 [Bacteriovoracales bacterium]|nr:hypothetical protein [Bacteriovoracales bacterium]